jgi:phospholipid transport system substrate-binding protein
MLVTAFCSILLSATFSITTEAKTDVTVNNTVTVNTPANTKPAASTPAQFVQNLGNTALMSLTGKNITRKTREDRVRSILRNNFDVAAIGKFALGTYWRQASESQRKEYMNLFEDMIVQTYTTRFEDYSGQKLKVDGSAPSGATDFIVSSQVIQKDGPPVHLEWRVRKKDAGLRIVDVVVEGVSMSITQRSDFASVIQNGGGSIDALLADLRQRKDDASTPKKKT